MNTDQLAKLAYETASEANIATQILTTDDATVVDIVCLVNGVDLYEAKGSSRRDPRDKVNPEIGQKLALGRAIRKLGREMLKDANKLVREQEQKRQQQIKASLEAKAVREKRSAAARKNNKKAPSKTKAKASA